MRNNKVKRTTFNFKSQEFFSIADSWPRANSSSRGSFLLREFEKKSEEVGHILNCQEENEILDPQNHQCKLNARSLLAYCHAKDENISKQYETAPGLQFTYPRMLS